MRGFGDTSWMQWRYVMMMAALVATPAWAAQQDTVSEAITAFAREGAPKALAPVRIGSLYYSVHIRPMRQGAKVVGQSIYVAGALRPLVDTNTPIPNGRLSELQLLKRVDEMPFDASREAELQARYVEAVVRSGTLLRITLQGGRVITVDTAKL